MSSVICLGTVKLGTPDYGYSKSPSVKKKEEFVLQALNLGVSALDTSPRYGESEELIENQFENFRLGLSESQHNLDDLICYLTSLKDLSRSLRFGIESAMIHLYFNILQLLLLHSLCFNSTLLLLPLSIYL